MQPSLGSKIVETSKMIAKSVANSSAMNRKGKVSNVDLSDYSVDVDLDLPLGTVIMANRAIVTPYAGDGYGFICSSRENNSVITIPVDGDNDKSVVLGRTYDLDIEKPPRHNYGDVMLRHQLGHQWSFSYTQPVTGSLNLDASNIVKLGDNGEPIAEHSTTSNLRFKISSEKIPEILPGQLVRVVLKYDSEDSSNAYLDVYVEWEDKVKYEEDGEYLYIQIDDSNTVVGGPLFQSDQGQTAKHYLIAQYSGKYYGMLLSPDKGDAQFSHYLGMGLFMDEYASRIPIGSGMNEDGMPIVDENGNLKSWEWNGDSFLDETLDVEARLSNFPRGSLNLKHYSGSGLLMEEKVKKTYPLNSKLNLVDPDNLEEEQSGYSKDDWNQSAIGLNLSLLRTTPVIPLVYGLDDVEKPLASLVMEDDCKNSYYNSAHIRFAHDNSAVQAITLNEINYYEVSHLDDVGELLDQSLPGTRPSRIQFYDLKRRARPDDIDAEWSEGKNDENEDDRCIHYLKDQDQCRLNLVLDQDSGDIDIDGDKYSKVPDNEEIATLNSGEVDKKFRKKKCPCWPGCDEGHFTNPNIDLPLAIRNNGIRVNNIDLLMKPKANAEFAHYTGSGLFLEEQLPKNKFGHILYDEVRTYHAPIVHLRLREWDYLPKCGEEEGDDKKISYKEGEKNNAHEPKRYDLLDLKFETIYGDREDNFEDTGTRVKFTDLHYKYKTAIKMFLGQKLYGNLLPDEEDNDVIQKGSRFIIEDLLSDEGAPLAVWAPTTSAEDSKLEDGDGDTRILFPKGKLELMHYTNSGLLIEEQDDTTAANADTDYSGVGHKMAMSLVYNYWSANSAGDDEYRPVDSVKDTIDPMSIMRWEETSSELFPNAGTYADDATSAVNWYVYLNSHRDQQITLETPNPWWDESEAADVTAFRSGAYVSIREEDNLETDSAPRAPVVEITDTKNSIKMDSKVGGEKIEITSRKTQFVNEASDVNKIIMDSMGSIMKFINGYEGAAEAGNNSVVMNKADGSIIITDVNDNVIKIDGDGITITDTVSGNTITMGSDSIKLDSGGTTIELKNGGDINMAAGGATIDIANGGDIDITAGTAVNIAGSAGVTIEGSQVTITGGMLTVDGVAAPTGSGPWCALPACLFSGAPHVGNMVSGT